MAILVPLLSHSAYDNIVSRQAVRTSPPSTVPPSLRQCWYPPCSTFPPGTVPPSLWQGCFPPGSTYLPSQHCPTQPTAMLVPARQYLPSRHCPTHDNVGPHHDLPSRHCPTQPMGMLVLARLYLPSRHCPTQPMAMLPPPPPKTSPPGTVPSSLRQCWCPARQYFPEDNVVATGMACNNACSPDCQRSPYACD